MNARLAAAIAASEKSTVALAGTLTVRTPHAKALKLKLRGTTLLFQRAGQKGALTLSAASRRRLGALLRAGGKKSTGTFRLTGTAADPAHNKRHLAKSVRLSR